MNFRTALLPPKAASARYSGDGNDFGALINNAAADMTDMMQGSGHLLLSADQFHNGGK